MVSKTRQQRIADRIREEISEMLLKDISDPRLTGISITDVTVDRELGYANIYVSALEGSTRWTEIHQGLIHAQGFLRHGLTQKIELRTFPQLRFHWDPTFEHAQRIEQLFDEIHKENPPSEVNPGNEIDEADKEAE